MNSVMLPETQECSDADLVRLCLAHDHEAFRLVVERYKNLLCGLAYSMCGDVGQSEDLAQETFLVAWRKLSELRSPEHLKAWLCGILRNLGHNSTRAQAGDPLRHAECLEEALIPEQEGCAPSERAMSMEEQALLWGVIRTLPETYREPLVLYYRNGECTARVADALDISEDTARQRLARGRALLGRRITTLVESRLRSSGPSTAFTLAVLAAIPATTASAAAAGASASGLTAEVAKGMASAGKLFGIAGNGISVVAGLLGLAGHILNTRSTRERRFVMWSSIGMVAFAIVSFALGGIWLAAQLLQSQGHWTMASTVVLGMLVSFAPLDAWAIWMAIRQVHIRSEDASSRDLPIQTARRGYRLSMIGAMAAISLGATGWLATIAAIHDDAGSGAIMLGLAALATVAGATWAIRTPAQRGQALIYLLWFLAAVDVLAIGLKWDRWFDSEATGSIDAGPVLVMVSVFFGAVRVGWYLKERFLRSQNLRRDTIVALAGFALLLGLGLVIRGAVARWEVPEIKSVQALLADVAPNGSISFKVLNWSPNLSSTELREIRFVSSDPQSVTQIFDSRGRPLQFTAENTGTHVQYAAALERPVPPGGSVFTRTRGQLSTGVTVLPNNLWEREQRHWPATGVPTLRVERYRWPRGTELLKSDFPGVTRRKLPDGRLEVRLAKVIAPGGHIEFRLQLKAPLER